MQPIFDMEGFSDNYSDQENRHCNTNSDFHGILGGNKKRLEAKILLNPFRERLALLARLALGGDSLGRKLEFFCQ